MRSWLAGLLLVATAACANAATTVTEADTLIIDGTIFRLDGLEGRQTDQVCVDDKGAKWQCGIDARDRLREWIGTRKVRCDDKGADRTYKKRRMGVCWVEGETASINQWLARKGWRGSLGCPRPLKAEQDSARDNRRGMWKGCFVTPEALRRFTISTAQMFGAACPSPNNWQVRNMMFPDYPAMPAGCPIKGRVALRAQVAGNLGIYHPESCASHARTKNPHRWFLLGGGGAGGGLPQVLHLRVAVIG